MHLTLLDYAILLTVLLASVGIALWYGRAAAKDAGSFFLGGRSLPGWLAGLSIAATTFAADTPLLVTELVRQHGISGNWLWWNMLIGGMLTTFFFARLWRRAGILTDVELVAIRYSGRAAHWLRTAKALYFGVLLNAIVIAWVNLAMATLLQVYFGLSPTAALLATGGLLLLTTLLASVGGLQGVVVTDAFQFGLAMVGCIVLAWLVLDSPQVGGTTGLQAHLQASGQAARLNFFPSLSDLGNAQTLSLSLAALLTFFGLQWWAGWYPGNEPGGGGYVAQRLMATRSEGQAQQAAFLFQVIHYCIRPWPWIVVALATLVLYPDLPPAQAREGYLMAMRDFLPPGLQGLMLAAFLAAYMSTISTHVNWGASYVVNDGWALRYPGRSNGHYVGVSRISTLGIAAVGMVASWQLSSLEQAFHFLLQASAGLGGVLVMRWYWWRVSAWSELVAMAAPLFITGLLQLGNALHWWAVADFPDGFALTALLTTLLWVAAAYVLPGTDASTLNAFAHRVQPRGWWPGGGHWQGMGHLALSWVMAVVAAYSLLFLIGKWLLGLPGLAYITPVVVLSTTALWLLMRKR
jgi:Na+/proline symporter